MARDYSDVLNGPFGDEQTAPTAGLSYIFGSAVRLADDLDDAHEERRVAIYPCLADEVDSEVGQGMMCVLAWTLNALDGVTAIPVLVRSPAAQWKADDSAFVPDEFSLDGLGEDTIVTGVLSRDGGTLSLTLTATTDVEDVDDLTLHLIAADEREILNELLRAASKIAVWLGQDAGDTGGAGEVQGGASIVRDWLASTFAWHRSALDSAVQADASDAKLDLTTPDFKRLTSDSSEAGLTGLTVRGVALVLDWFEATEIDSVVETVTSLPHWQAAAGALARALLERGAVNPALETLEAAVEKAPEIALNWLVLARLYAAVQQSDLAIETLQDGIERHSDYAPLLMQYGEALLGYADQNHPLAEVIFIDEGREPAAAFEGIAALQEAAKLLSGDQRSMAYVQLISAAVQYDPQHIWPAFAALALSDETAAFTELALNAVAAQDDVGSAADALEQAALRFATQGRAWRNLAYVRYLLSDYDTASEHVQKALSLARSTRERGEYELLNVYTAEGDAERTLAEIADALGTGGQASDATLEFLEWIVSEAPHYAEGYLLLGRAYVADGEDATALEVLLDAEKNLGIDANVVVAITDLLLDSDEAALALEYVTKGLEAFPRHVPLLARAALVAHALDDDDGAKSFLRQAHNIAPYHREIMRVTRRISADEED